LGVLDVGFCGPKACDVSYWRSSSSQVYGSWPNGLDLDDNLPNVAGVSDPLPPGIGFDALVDAVVQRIERKVVEEMERRGRWRGGEVY